MDQKPKYTNNRRDDSFQVFMFGNRGIEEKTAIENDQNLSKSTEDHPDTENRLSGDDWFFGKRNHHTGKENRQQENSQLDELLKHVNVDELMKNVDDLLTSISHIKPLWKKVDPVIKKWMKH